MIWQSVHPGHSHLPKNKNPAIRGGVQFGRSEPVGAQVDPMTF
jgi:hypothetical protein